MRRAGHSNGSVPAFFTRSRAKNFFGTNSIVTRSRNDNKQPEMVQEPQVKTEEQEKKKGVKGTDKILEISQDQEQQQGKNQQPDNDNTTPAVESEGSKNPEVKVIDLDMKVEGEDVKVPVVKIEKLTDQDKQSKNVSATTKAVQQMQQTMDLKKNWKKKQKLPLYIRRRKMNQRLNKLLTPKSGLIFLHELKPGCTFKIQEQPSSNPPIFVAQVEYNNKVLAVGQGMTKPSAKNAAAENAIKVLVAEALTQQAVKHESTQNDEDKVCVTTGEDELMDTNDDLSLAGLASFAMYKMFTEWQSQGTDVPLLSFQQKKKPTVSKAPPTKKELPQNADKLHPSFLLNTMRPGIVSVELERSAKDNVSFVTVGYEIDGKMYRGSGSNKKEARKKAAQAALTDLYGLKYEK